MLSDIFQRFLQKRPVATMVLILLENFLSADQLDRWFNTVRQSQYTKDILFSSIVGLMLNVVCNIRPSVHSAYRDSEIQASVVALYAKLQNMEWTTSQALVRYIAGEAEALIEQVGGASPALLPGYRVQFLDGNSIEATEHRLEVLRETHAGALPGKALVVFDPQSGLAIDVFPCEDGHAQERSLLTAVAATIQARDVYVMDRNFCVLEFLFNFHQRSAFFVARQHGNTPYKRLTELKFVGNSATGKVFEQEVEITAPTGETLQIRRVVVTLNKPTRNDDKNLILLTNLPKEEVDGLTVAELYRARWGIETAFQKLESHLNSEINTLGYPKAALFSFCLALVAFNIYAVVMAVLQATHPDQVMKDVVSEYYIAQEIDVAMDGISIAITENERAIFAQASSSELATLLLNIASYVDLKKYKKNPRGPKKPLIKRTQFKGHPHVSTAKLLDGVTPRVLAAKAA
ncbi:MAG TPA: IS4 family transposase [Candidatus Limnocylindrales bacterium]|nr:IS4 family transposase [Candidatus Limnocylindrales bacterium]